MLKMGGIAFRAILSRLALFAGDGEIRRGWAGIWHLGFGLSEERDRAVAGVSRSEAGQGRGPPVGKYVLKMGGFGGWAVMWGSQVLKIGGEWRLS